MAYTAWRNPPLADHLTHDVMPPAWRGENYGNLLP